MEIDLIQRIKEFKPNESYILTFSIDLHYYEAFLLPLLQKNDCKKNVIIADGSKINESLEANASNLYKLGRDYILFPIHISFAFHPKVYLFKRVEKGRTGILCFVGSGNLTYPGLNTNQEIFFEEEWNGNGKAPFILQQVQNYFSLVFKKCHGKSIELARSWLNNGYPHSYEEKNESDPELIKYPDDNSIFSQFMVRIGRRPINKLFITAAFFDEDLSALKRVITEFKPKEVEIMIQTGKTDIATKKLLSLIQSCENITLKAFEPKEYGNRYLHAKLMIVADDNGEHVMAGSANLSDVAFLGNPKAYNYEANIYQFNDTPQSIYETLNILELSKPLSIDDLPEETSKNPKEKPKQTISSEILSAECDGDYASFIILNAEKKQTIKGEICFNNGGFGEVFIEKEKGSDDIFKCNAKDVYGAVSIRIVGKEGLYSNWVPVLYVYEIDRRSKRNFKKVDKYKDIFLRATDETSGTYLFMLMDSLIDEPLKIIERRKSTRISTKAKKTNELKGRATIDITAEAPSQKKDDTLTYENSFRETIDYVISALRERKHSSFIESDLSNTEQDRDFEEYDEKRQKAEEERDEKSETFTISKRLKLRRSIFIKNEFFGSPLDYVSYFSLIALPHIPLLHETYKLDNEKRGESKKFDKTCPCIKLEEWEEFIFSALVKIGKSIFKKASKDFCLDFDIGFKKDVFELCIVSIFYACAPVYRLLKKGLGSSTEGENDTCLLLNRVVILITVLIKNYFAIEGKDLTMFKNKLSEIRGHFPCRWLNVESSLRELFIDVELFLDEDFNTPVVWDYGKVSFLADKGFIMNVHGRDTLFWASEEKV